MKEPGLGVRQIHVTTEYTRTKDLNSDSNLDRTYVVFNIIYWQAFGQNLIWNFAKLFLGIL